MNVGYPGLAEEYAQLLTKPTLSVDEVARLIGCSRDTLERRLRTRTLPPELRPLPRVGIRQRWATANVRRWLQLERG